MFFLESEIVKLIDTINKSLGVCNTPVKNLKNYLDYFKQLLTYLINLCYTRHFP